MTTNFAQHNEECNGWVACSVDEGEALMERQDGSKIDVKPCPVCTAHIRSYTREDFHADS